MRVAHPMPERSRQTKLSGSQSRTNVYILVTISFRFDLICIVVYTMMHFFVHLWEVMKLVTNALETEEWKVLERLLIPANALVVRCMLETGLRISDVLKIRKHQLDSCNFTVSECKTGKLRNVTISEQLRADMLAQSGVAFVFQGKRDIFAHRTRQVVWWDIKRAARAMRIELNVAPHSTRKTYAVDLWRETHSIDAVKDALNHDSIATTVIYLLDEFRKISKSGT